MFTFVVYKKELRWLLLTTNDFKMDDVNDEVKKDIKWKYNFLVKTVTMCLAVGVLLSVTTYVIFAIFNGDIFLLVYVPNKYYLTKNVVFMLEVYFIYGACIIYICFDGMFMYMAYKCVSQLIIIKYKIENLMNFHNPNFEINKCINMHSLIIR